MPTITTTDVQNGTVTDAAVVNNNFTAVKSVVNGSLDDSNLSASAGIARSKMQQVRFRATRTTNQTLADATYVKIQYDVEDYDPNGVYDNITNFRFTPTVAGKYHCTARVGFGSVNGRANVELEKNGATVARSMLWTPSAGDIIIEVSDDVDMNGSTDYLEVFAFHFNGSSRDTFGTVGATTFSGHLVAT